LEFKLWRVYWKGAKPELEFQRGMEGALERDFQPVKCRSGGLGETIGNHPFRGTVTDNWLATIILKKEFGT
jgi:hypothetical protein